MCAEVLTWLMFYSRLDAKTFIDINLFRFNDFVNRIAVALFSFQVRSFNYYNHTSLNDLNAGYFGASLAIDYGVTSYQTFLTKYVQITHLFGVLWAFFYQRRTKYFPELQFPDRQQFVAGKEANFLFRFLSVYRTPF